MRKMAMAAAVILGLSTPSLAQSVNHQGYTTRNGTYVAPHVQSAPDRSYNNNYTTSPNVNPYTGQQGTRQPTMDDRPPSSGGLYGQPSRYR